jgi:sugar transferase (PEP-CTERM/EpsH1 system associated)
VAVRGIEAAGRAVADVPLVAHVIFRLDIGGLENGVVNLINHMPAQRFRHTVVCLTSATEFRRRIRDPDVQVHALGKREGNDPRIHLALWRLFRRLRPAVVHTRNIATIEAQLPAFLAGVPARVHGEHGRDAYDVDGSNTKYRLLRRALSPLIHRWAPMSQDLKHWLTAEVGIRCERVTQLYNGVDLARFQCARDGDLRDTPLATWRDQGKTIFASVGRLETIKDPLNLVRAFIAMPPAVRENARLALIGGGALAQEAERALGAAGVAQQCWLAGPRDDVPRLMAGIDVFVLPSLGEGISNTILEAMACSLPVIATAVGGNPELVTPDTGMLVPAADPRLLAQAMTRYANDRALGQAHGSAGHLRVEEHFSLDAMVRRYVDLYDGLLERVH